MGHGRRKVLPVVENREGPSLAVGQSNYVVDWG